LPIITESKTSSKMRITDNNYELPEITALRVIETAQTGANRPLFIRGRDNKTKQKGFYVLKYQGAELNQLPYNFWDKVREKMPIEWQTPEINQIEAHITQISSST
jgi:hypothetical protein